MMRAVFYFGLIFSIASIQSSSAVDIKKFTVPSAYILNEENSEPLILDCEYDISSNETGLVVKWLLNGINIYQWIPSQKAYSLSVMKKHIDTTYSPSTNKYDQYRAISIIDPQWNMTGNYTCSVQTFQGMSQQTAELKIINRETDFNLVAEIDEEGDDLAITCSVDDIFPSPQLAILINGVQLSIEVTAEKDKKGPFDVVATSKKSLEEFESPATITCILTIPGTDYEKRKETVFTAPSEPVEELEREDILDEETGALSHLESTSEPVDSGRQLQPFLMLSFILIYAEIFSRVASFFNN